MERILTLAGHAVERCRELALCSEEPHFITRTFLSAPMHEVHAKLRAWMEAADMEVCIDAAGNIRGCYSAPGPSAPRLLIGSHLDTVPHAGAFDGVLGVLMGVALVESLAGTRPPFHLEVIGFSEEEGVRFGEPFLGSRALIGALDERLLNCVDSVGRSVRDALTGFGLDPSRLPEAQPGLDALGYLEFHIEQGPVLESLDLPLGIVDAIVGQTRAEFTFSGAANHAGTTPMELRRDALAGAAEWLLEVERYARATPGMVATVGAITAQPGAGNVIAGSARATLDLRHARDEVRRRAAACLSAAARDIAARRQLSVSRLDHLDQNSVAMDPDLTGLLEGAVRSAGFPAHRMTSGAGHDAMILARRMPAAMLFVRSPGGISHHPDETVLPQDVAAALATGMQFLEALGARLG